MSATVAEHRLNKDQKLAFSAAWLGWAFDGLDGFLYLLIAVKFVTQLSTVNGVPADPKIVAERAALIQGVFLVGWALGGAIFGRIGDKLGRTKTLTLTILTYAIFTGLHAFATEWWHLLIFRFIAALGIGGEWAAGSALVSETLPDKYRHLGGAILQSAYMTGQIMAAYTIGAMAKSDPRWIFLIGVLPAFFTMWFRKNLKEPEVWHEERQTNDSSVSQLFKADLIKTTLLTAAITSIALTVIWGVFYYHPQVIRQFGAEQGMSKTEIEHLVSRVTIWQAVCNIVANFACMAIFKRVGVRYGLSIVMAAAAFAMMMYGRSTTLNEVAAWGFVTVFFAGGMFALFPMYLPPLFPTLVRTTGAGLCYNIGRVISGIGTFYAATWAHELGPQNLIPRFAVLFVPGVIVAMLLPQMKSIERRVPATA